MTRAIYPSLKGKRVFISGGGSGIGEGLLEAFAGQGAKVAFCDVAVAPSEALALRLASADHPPLFYPVDLRDIDAVQAMMAAVEARLGGIDILINNAANDDRHAMEEVTPAYWDDRMAVNLRHLFFAAQAAVPAMKRAGGGVILSE
jgi:NAD(P)-dependent dehydrogenase (short-subunit alcohol dehydrogenase family)